HPLLSRIFFLVLIFAARDIPTFPPRRSSDLPRPPVLGRGRRLRGGVRAGRDRPAARLPGGRHRGAAGPPQVPALLSTARGRRRAAERAPVPVPAPPAGRGPGRAPCGGTPSGTRPAGLPVW